MSRKPRLSRYASLLLVFALLAGWAQQQLTAQPQTGRHIFEGVVSDASCGAKHKQSDAKACIEACLGRGGKYVLVVGDIVHELEGDAAQFKSFAAERVRVSASLEGNTLKVATISRIEKES